MVDGFDQTHAPHLEEIVRRLSPAHKALYHRKHQTQIALYQLFPGFFIPLLALEQQLLGLCTGQHFQFGCIDAADLYFPLHGLPPRFY